MEKIAMDINGSSVTPTQQAAIAQAFIAQFVKSTDMQIVRAVQAIAQKINQDASIDQGQADVMVNQAIKTAAKSYDIEFSAREWLNKAPEFAGRQDDIDTYN